MNAPAPSVTPFRIIDLFAGPGGLDLAARHLGIPSKGIEWDADACATRGANDLDTTPGDVREFHPKEFSDRNVLAGGPPCQTFTVAGNGHGRRALEQVRQFAERLQTREDRQRVLAELKVVEDEVTGRTEERTGLVLEPLRWALDAIDGGQPYQAIVLEQVPTVLPVWELFGEILKKEGYAVAPPRVLHTEEYGVPQTRRRAILVARWMGEGRLFREPPQLPTPSHGRYRKGQSRNTHGMDQQPWVRMQDVLTDRKRPFNVISNYSTGGVSENRGIRSSDLPSATVTGKISRNRIVDPHGVDLPRLSNSEAGLLQTFPPEPEWKWAGNAVAQQIGNAVPPRLGMHVLAAALGLESELAKALKDQFNY